MYGVRTTEFPNCWDFFFVRSNKATILDTWAIIVNKGDYLKIEMINLAM